VTNIVKTLQKKVKIGEEAKKKLNNKTLKSFCQKKYIEKVE